MSKPATPSTTTSNVNQSTTVDPAIRAALMGNVDMASILTSGMLPSRPGQNPLTNGGVAGSAPQPVAGPGGYWDQETGAWTSGAAPYNPGTAGEAGPILNADGTPFVPPSSFTAGFDPSQIAAQDVVTGIANTPVTRSQLGGDAFDRYTNFSAPQLSASTVGNIDPRIATMLAQTPQATTSLATAQQAAAAQATSGRFTDLDFSKYLMPGQEQIIDPLKGYFGEMTDRALANTASKGRMGSAVRGSNDQLRDAAVSGEMALQSAPVISSALQNLYGISTGLATGDLNRDADTSRYNAGISTDVAKFNAGLGTEVSRFNAGEANNTSRFNATADLQRAMANAGFADSASRDTFTANNQRDVFDAGQTQAAAGTNIETAMRSPLIAMQAAQAGAGATTSARDLAIQNAGLLETVGAERRNLDQARLEDPFRAFALRQGAVTGAAPTFTGSSTSSTGTAPSPYGSRGGLATGLGAAAGAYGLAGAAGMTGAAAGAGTAAVAASPWLWPLVLGAGAVGALS